MSRTRTTPARKSAQSNAGGPSDEHSGSSAVRVLQNVVGFCVGDGVGWAVGGFVGKRVGFRVGAAVGSEVGRGAHMLHLNGHKLMMSNVAVKISVALVQRGAVIPEQIGSSSAPSQNVVGALVGDTVGVVLGEAV